MSHLTNKIVACGLCSSCRGQNVNAITESEANAIIEVCKAEFIEVIEDIHPYASSSNESTSMQQAAIDAIKAVK